MDEIEIKDIYVEPQFYATVYESRDGSMSITDVDSTEQVSRHCDIDDYTFEKLNWNKYRIKIEFSVNTGDKEIKQKLNVKSAQKLIASGEIDGSYSDSMEITFTINGINDADVDIIY